MPVTAKLSKKFYDVLGEDVANELVEWFNQVDATYRTDLRELNELNFQRFDAKLEQRIAGVEARLGERFIERFNDLQKEIANLRGELRVEFHREIGSVKAELIKTYLYFWAPVVLGVIGLYFKR